MGKHGDGPYASCTNWMLQFNGEDVRQTNQFAGVTIYYMPYTKCFENCNGWSSYDRSDVLMVFSQFVLPTVIFALGLLRRWHLDFPYNYGARDRLPRRFRKAWKVFNVFYSLLAGLASIIVATVDIIVWISCILTCSGPILYEGIFELFLDHRIRSALRESSTHRPSSTGMRRNLLVILFCGNFSWEDIQIEEERFQEDVHHIMKDHTMTFLARLPLNDFSKQLLAIMDVQADFSSSVGVPALFFLGGFLFNALSINDLTAQGYNWTPFAIWLMPMVYISVIAALSANGGNSRATSAVLSDRFPLRIDRRYHVLVDLYSPNLHPEDPYPVSLWDRGLNKGKWLNSSNFRGERGFPRDTSWIVCTTIGFSTLLLISFPSIMSFLLAHELPFPHHGCRSVSYLVYGAGQIVLVVAATARSIYWLQSRKPRRLLHLLCRSIVYLVLAISFLVSFLGSISQILGVYNNCLCRTALSTWWKPPSERWTLLGDLGSATPAYTAQKQHLSSSLTWTTAAVALVVSAVGWWVQKTLRATVREEIKALTEPTASAV